MLLMLPASLANLLTCHTLLQIVGINNIPVKDFQHTDVVKMFQSSEKISLTVLPSKFQMVIIYVKLYF